MAVVGTRPEIIRLSRVIAALDKRCRLTLVHTGQNHDYELSQIFFDELEIRKPDHFLEAAVDGAPMATVGNILAGMERLVRETRPDAVLILGDTNSCLAALPAKRAQIPVFHMEAGNRCFDERVPEEINRRIVDHISDINLTYSDIAREYLLREGLPPDRIIKSGSPMYEVLAHHRERIDSSKILQDLGLRELEYFVVSAHREENIESEKSFVQLITTLNRVAETFDLPVIVSTHPRTRTRIDRGGARFHHNVQLLKPLGFFDYIKLQQGARAVLSDSGTITEESSILNFPALNIREAHERPEGMEEGSVIMTGLEPERILQGLSLIADQRRGEARDYRLVADYSMPNVSEKIVRIIHSYTDYVNRTVWKQY